MRGIVIATIIGVTLSGCASMYPDLQQDIASQGLIERDYDQYRDIYSWHLRGMTVAGTFYHSTRVGSELRLGAIAYQYGPANPDQPNTFSIVLYLASTSRDWQYLYSRPTVDLLVDGERVHLGEATRSSRVRDGYVTEDMLLIVPRETLQRIAEARQVSGQLARTQFELQPIHLERLRAFLATIPPGPPPTP